MRMVGTSAMIFVILAACETEPQDGDTSGPTLMVFEEGHDRAILTSHPPRTRADWRRCSWTNYFTRMIPNDPVTLTFTALDPSGIARMRLSLDSRWRILNVDAPGAVFRRRPSRFSPGEDDAEITFPLPPLTVKSWRLRQAPPRLDNQVEFFVRIATEDSAGNWSTEHLPLVTEEGCFG